MTSIDPGEVVPLAELNKLRRDSRKLKAIREILDEFHLRKKLVSEHISEDHLHKLRRKAINEVYSILRRKDI